MPITYPVSPEARFAVYQISTDSIIARNRPWPRADGGPITDLDPDYVYLQQVTQTPPDVDGRLFTLVSSEDADTKEHELIRSWRAVPRSVEERLEMVAQVEAERTSQVLDVQREAIESRLAVGKLVDASLNGQVLSAEDRASLEAYATQSHVVAQNRARRLELEQQIRAGLTPDLDAGWHPPIEA